MSIRKRYGFGMVLFVLAMVVLTLFLAPRSGSVGNGSTYSRFPAGYGAWYAYMEDRGTPVQRWEKPPSVLFQPPEEGASFIQSSGAQRPNAPMTLVQIQSDFSSSVSPLVYDQTWIQQGNALVQLGIRAGVTDAPFQSAIATPVGDVVVETRRRHSLATALTYQPLAKAKPKALLEDEYGAIAWTEQVGKGEVVFVVTPFLAANAYQDAPGNFEFLATLLDEIGHPVYVDEYLHGYKDEETVAEEVQGNLLTYLWQTPISILVIQIGLGLAFLIWGFNRRLGAAAVLSPPAQDSNRAYIEALAAVLRKANCTDFTVETLRKAEYLNVQRSLGLGDTVLDAETVLAAWEAQTGRSPQELHPLLPPKSSGPKPMTETELRQWLEAIAQIRGHLPERDRSGVLPSLATAATPSSL